MVFDSASSKPSWTIAGMPPSGLTARCQSGRGCANGTSRSSAVWPSSASRKRTFWAFDESALSWSTSGMESSSWIGPRTLASSAWH